MKKFFFLFSMILVFGITAIAWDADAVIIEILCTESEGCGSYTGTTTDGTIFLADPNPTDPSTGTGVFQPFKRVQESTGGDGMQNGFNTDQGEPDINFDTKDGSNWTRSVLFSELGTINGYYVLSLDANQSGESTSTENQITITDMQIYIGGNLGLANPEATGMGPYGNGYTGTIFDSTDNGLLGLTPIWTLDSLVNGDVDVILQASICDSNGQCGSGHGDLGVFIPENLFSGTTTDYFVLYTEYEGANDGFEEWRFNAAVPEPGTMLLLGTGLIGLIGFRRKIKR